ncbi:ABC transporter ATP-binding protein [Prauserella rugosa]|uniref:Carbohydrate ABC transporter ATP-binding protein, CUT1 family (TC 3.A.1.1.-) n=1 Tax=Prauserella rugosa TaxID=43354 RepID=A0A660CG34_9PSEU|nr:sn-glycerol-3-phosphate ABC transporter ATP-binding protein UgpC [Prauserella rugosa]KID29161.1 carbohydrate ABC transporter ATP-binding protein, CUT1 family [Prauserella sp. Am3]KMS88450.1 sugar ABC transporter ATP-binding protein [Streptomyces regensis]TWH21374.1 carbohydrate ABC transporter ATP-binding protein, CUT1 family (TC 3.A.1.1.-) [Prauserella rugosa]
MAQVEYAGASRVYPGANAVRAVDSLDLCVGDGEFLVLVGPSGSGKSTALRMAAGLEDIDEGTISIGDRDVTNLPPKDRDIAMVFQSYALYPHMTVAENMAFSLKLRGVSKSDIKAKVDEAAALLDLTKYLDRKPKALSGGQRQRVAMGRAIVREPSVFLMDEPLSNLDAKLRVETRAGIAALQQRLGTTTIYVTHDQVEAMTMGDRVAVLRDGVLQQCASPRELYDTPANVFVAGFIGSPAMNLLNLPVDGGNVKLGELSVQLPVRTDLPEVTAGVRPESLALVGPGDDGFDLRVELVEELGADAYVHGALAGHSGRVVVRADGRTPPRLGETVRVAVRDTGEVHVFDPESGLRLSGQ